MCCWSYISENKPLHVEGGANITAQVVSASTERSPLTQGGLEIEIKASVI